MSKVVYFDCFSGASGDMLLGALLDAGLELDQLEANMAKLGVSDYKLTLAPQMRHGISGSKFDVVDQGHERPVRNLHAVRHILEGSPLPEDVVVASLNVFQHLAEAESQIHGMSIDEVHFHEVGAVDALVDIVGFCWAIHHLGIEAVYASPLPLGSGTVRTEHGLLPVPAPATLALLAMAGVPTIPSKAETELVTPTGAALLSVLATFSRPPMRVDQVGYGFGTRELPWANMVRVWIGEETSAHEGLGHGHAHEHVHPHTHEHPHDDGHTHPHTHEHPHDAGHAHPHTHEHAHAHEGEQAHVDHHEEHDHSE